MNITVVDPRRGCSKGIIRRINDLHPEIKVDVVSTPSVFNQRMKGKLLLSIQMVINLFYILFRPKLSIKKLDAVLLNGLLVALPFLFVNSFRLPTQKPRRIVVVSFFLHGFGASLLIRKFLTYLFSDTRVSLVAQTKSEVAYFSQLMDAAQIAYVPYCLGRVDFNVHAGAGSEYIFAGGFTNRDYETLIHVAKRVPCNFILAVSRLNKLPQIPDNIQVLKDISNRDFNGFVKNSLFVIIPLKEDVGSSGQMVALTAMSFAKAVIYTDIGCISEYFSAGETGLPYRLNDGENLYDATMFMINNPDVRDALGHNAREMLKRKFTWARYSNDIVALLVD